MMTARKYTSRTRPTDMADMTLLKDSASLTSASTDSDEGEISGDETVKAGGRRKDYHHRLDALWQKVHKVNKTKPKQVYIHKIEDVKPKKCPNDIIWNAYATTKSFRAIIGGVVKTQAVARRWLVLKEIRELEMRRFEAATKIQGVWRRWRYRSAYRIAVKDLTICQSFIRCFLAVKKVEQMKLDVLEAEAKEKRIMEEKMATKISSAWRCFRWQILYKRIIKDVIRVQCVARGFVASLELNRLKEEKKRRVEDMATKISSVWKGFCSQAAFRRTVKSIVLCQSLARCFLASKALQTLKHEHVMTSAALIQGQARGITVRKYFVSLKCSTIVVQSLARRRAASRYLQYLKEEQRIREAEMASKIAAVWKGFRIRSGHIYILLAARRHERRCAAASRIQANWRAIVEVKSYIKAKNSIALLQSSIRMLIVMSRVKKMRAKLERASNYHSTDCYLYTKKRTAASITIQATYRMHKLHKKYLAQKLKSDRESALLKKQESYLKRYAKRMNQVNGKTDETNKSEPISDEEEGVEVDLDQHRTVCPSLGKKQPSHAPETAHLAVFDFEASKERQVAASTIQKAYRRCFYKNLDEMNMNVEIVPCTGTSACIVAQILDCSCWFQDQ